MATQIKIISATRSETDGSLTVPIEIRINIPAPLQVLANKKEIAESYASTYGITKVDADYIYFNKVCTFESGTTQAQMELQLETIGDNYVTALTAFALLPTDELIGKTYDGNTWSYIPPTPPTPTPTP
jgi:hypothetical protein